MDDHDPKTCMSQKAMHALYEMHTGNMLCDATITLQDDTVLNVHRAILCSCSEYFRAVFTTSLNAGQTNVCVPGIRTPIMKRIVGYAYLRHCDIDDQCVHELFCVADYVAMTGLMRLCSDYMIRMLQPENCVGLLRFARVRVNAELIAAAEMFIRRRFVDVAKMSNEILDSEADELLAIISDDMLNTKTEEPVWELCVRWVDHAPAKRGAMVPKLLQGVRLGLLPTTYLMRNVQDHPYVSQCPDARPHILETLRFVHDLDLHRSGSHAPMPTPALAMPRLPHDVIFAIGGWSVGAPQSYIETYDTRADRWNRVCHEDPAGPRSYHGTAIIGARIYCVGGFDGVEYFNTCSAFDARTREWCEIAPMHHRRCYVSVAVVDGKIYACGGYDGIHRQNSVERYDPATNQWTMVASMNAMRSDAHACTLDDGRVWVTGGFNGQECMNTVEVYEPAANVWTMVEPMMARRSGVSCIGMRGKLYVLGGFNGMARMNTCERYTPETKQWESIKEMFHPRSNFGVEVLDDMIFAVGGFNGLATIPHTECYDADRNVWLEASGMNINRSALTANLMSGLPNVRDYTHPNRDQLLEERKQRIESNDGHNGFVNVTMNVVASVDSVVNHLDADADGIDPIVEVSDDEQDIENDDNETVVDGQ